MMRKVAATASLAALVAALQGPAAAAPTEELDLGARVAFSAVDAVRDTPGGPDTESDIFSTMVRDGRGWDVDRVTDTVGVDVNRFAWAPDGTRLLVHGEGRFDPPGRVRVVTAFGTPMATVADAANSFDWSPDGTRVLLGLEDRVWTVTDAGTHPREVFAVPPLDLAGVRLPPSHVEVDWGPRRDLFVVRATAYSDEMTAEETWVVQTEPGADTATATRMDVYVDSPWSPDGAAFAHVDGDDRVIASTRDPSVEIGRFPAAQPFTWGPGDDEVTFIEAGTMVRVADRDGGNVRTLAELPHESAALDGWSPDGRYLAVSGPVVGADPAEWHHVTFVDATGVAHERLRAENVWPSGWLPDGSGAVYGANGFRGEPGTDVVVVPTYGTPRQLPNPSEQVRPDRPYVLGATIAPARFGDTARVMGRDRVATAIELSRAAFEAAGTVVVGRADNYPDALAGTPLAHQHDAPLLLTASDALDARVEAEVDRLGAQRAIVLGSRSVVSDDVVDRLQHLGVRTTRIGGVDRFATATMIADRLDDSRVFLVEGAHPDPNRGWPDAVAVSALAAITGHPVLLTHRDTLPEATADWLATHRPGEVTIIGSEVAVSGQVERAVDARVGAVTRIAGTDRYATSAGIADTAIDAGLDPSTTLVVTGADWPDALGAGLVAARIGGNLVLVPPTDLTGSATGAWLAAHRAAVDTAAIVGGVAAVPPAAQLQIVRALGG